MRVQVVSEAGDEYNRHLLVPALQQGSLLLVSGLFLLLVPALSKALAAF